MRRGAVQAADFRRRQAQPFESIWFTGMSLRRRDSVLLHGQHMAQQLAAERVDGMQVRLRTTNGRARLQLVRK